MNDPKFFLMRLSPDGKLSGVVGITGQPTKEALESVIRSKHFRREGNPLVMVELVSNVVVETVTNVEMLPVETRRKAGR